MDVARLNRLTAKILPAHDSGSFTAHLAAIRLARTSILQVDSVPAARTPWLGVQEPEMSTRSAKCDAFPAFSQQISPHAIVA